LAVMVVWERMVFVWCLWRRNKVQMREGMIEAEKKTKALAEGRFCVYIAL